MCVGHGAVVVDVHVLASSAQSSYERDVGCNLVCHLELYYWLSHFVRPLSLSHNSRDLPLRHELCKQQFNLLHLRKLMKNPYFCIQLSKFRLVLTTASADYGSCRATSPVI